MESINLFSSYLLGTTELKNRIVMAPMTRSRAVTHNSANEMMAEYYAQRAGAGLIITEGIAPSANGLGYARIPGLYTFEQVEKWKLVTNAVHDKAGIIFAQLMHTGRISHPLNMPPDTKILAPSAIKPEGKMYTDSQGLLDYPQPAEMTLAEINQTKKEFVIAAQNAINAGFDGIELHGANGYLLEQFFHPDTNKRTDAYGGSYENRARFVLEVVQETVDAIGWDRVGIRLSPFGIMNGLSSYPETEPAYTYLAEQLNKIGLVYIHLVDHSSIGAPEVPVSIKATIGAMFNGTLILSGGYDQARAEQDIEQEKADLIAFGRPFISNPDLVDRFRLGLQLNKELKSELLYSAGPEGYIDYPSA